MSGKTLKKILIANRGEIAMRIIRACRELGIRTVAVYSDIDEWSPHVLAADESFPLGGSLSKDSYLRLDKIMDIARKSGADAIHPGYGFLAENPLFPAACAKNKIIFIGPSADSMRKIGDKINARLLATKIKVPTVPGIYKSLTEDSDLKHILKTVGLPLTVKASAGGGGKGMRIVRHAKELRHSIKEARSEAKASFGNDIVYAEKYIESPRHIEVQVLADSFGNTVYLGERECSIQRRHQKLIEESPSPFVDSELRAKMGETACKIARAVGYANAGTVEFLVDRKKNFYFLEVNARLQVEHPVTEMVTGIDLVKEQIRIASGEKLRFSQNDIRIRGAAIECRINAENPYDGFVPSIGEINGVEESHGPFTRVDSTIEPGMKITMFYDPLMAKLITWGNNRAEAIGRMKRALREYKIVGVHTVIPFHIEILKHPKFLKGDFNTHFIENEFKFTPSTGRDAREAGLIAAALEYCRKRKETPVFTTKTSDGWKKASYAENKR